MIYDILTGCPLFRGMNAEAIRKAVDSDEVSATRLTKGDLIAAKDTAYSGLRILLEGSATGRLAETVGQWDRVDALETPE